jgi:hypothetical protein
MLQHFQRYLEAPKSFGFGTFFKNQVQKAHHTSSFFFHDGSLFLLFSKKNVHVVVSVDTKPPQLVIVAGHTRHPSSHSNP